MTLAANQPYFMPYMGYFQLMDAAETFVVLDDFAFMKQSWIARNRLLSARGDVVSFSLSVGDMSVHRSIAEHEYRDSFRRLCRTLECNYSRAPYYGSVMGLMEDILKTPSRNVAMLNARSLELTARYIGLKTRFVLSSQLDYDHSLRSAERVVAICRSAGASRYVNAIGGLGLYDKDMFAENGIELRFLKSDLPAYSQRGTSEFVPGLSIIDVLMNCEPERVREMLGSYILI